MQTWSDPGTAVSLHMILFVNVVPEPEYNMANARRTDGPCTTDTRAKYGNVPISTYLWLEETWVKPLPSAHETGLPACRRRGLLM